MEDKVIILKEKLSELLNNFNNENNRYCNPDFFISISAGMEELSYSNIIKRIKDETYKRILKGTVSGFISHQEIPYSKILIDELKENFNRKQKRLKFNVHLQKLIIEKDLTNADVIRKSDIDKGYFYKIIRGDSTPSKDKIIQIAIALNLDIEETNALLNMQGYLLWGENLRDFIILYCIENNLNLIEVNHILHDFKEVPLM